MAKTSISCDVLGSSTILTMKLKAPTVLLVGIAAILGLVVFAELQGGDRTGSDDEGQPLFSFEEDDVQSLTVETLINTLSFERDDDGAWQMVQPEAFPASDASVSFLLNLLVTGESDRTLSVLSDDLNDFGLEVPQATIDIVLEDETTHQILLGDFDFNQQSIYAQIDPAVPVPSGEDDRADELSILLISSSFDAAINRPVEEWQQVEVAPLDEITPEESIPEEVLPEEGNIPEENNLGEGREE